MNYLSEKKYSFHSDAVPKDTFGVASFSGTEGLTKLYRFDINLISDKYDIELDKLLEERAFFSIHRKDNTTIPFHGVLV